MPTGYPLTPEERAARKKAYNRAYRLRNLAVRRAACTAYYLAHKDDPEYKARESQRRKARHALRRGTEAYRISRRDSQLKIKYGITYADEQAMLAAQHQACVLCATPLVVGTWHVDHDHLTGRVRGILCGPCNRALGYFRENTTTMRNAVHYLENNHG